MTALLEAKTSHWNAPKLVLFLALALTVWLYPSIVGGKVLLPLDILTHTLPYTPPAPGPVHNGLIGDMLYENFMWKVFQDQAIAGGELPLWNPYTFCGHPLYTTGQSATFYPLNALFWIVPVMHAYVVYTWLHLLLGGWFMYIFCRRMGVGGFGAAVGAVAFAMGGFLATRLLWPMLLGSAIWLPLQLAWIDWMADARRCACRARGLALGALLFVQPLLAGFFEIAFYTYFTCGLFTLFRAGGLIWRERAVRPFALYLAKVSFVPVLAALLAAPQLLPFFEVIKLNIRAEQEQGSYEAMKGSAVEPRELLTMISPDCLGNPAEHDSFDLATRTWKGIRAANGADHYYFGPKNYVEVGYYFGLLPLGFVLLSPFARVRGRGFALTLIGLALAFALVLPVYKLFYDFVPGARQVRTPFRWVFLVLFGGTYLAAAGGQFWYERLAMPPRRWARWMATIVFVLFLAAAAVVVFTVFAPVAMERWSARLLDAEKPMAGAFATPGALAGFLWVNAFRLALFALGAVAVIALAWWRPWSRRAVVVLSLAALTLLAVDLGQASFGFYPHTDPATIQRKPPLIERLQADTGLYRIGRYGPDKMLYANLPLLEGIQDFGGYDSILLTDYIKFLDAIEKQHLVKFNIVMTIERPKSLDSPLLPLLNLRYLMSLKRFEHPHWEHVPVDGAVQLYRVRADRELPRAYMVASATEVASRDEALQMLKDGKVDVFKSVVYKPVDGEVAGGLDLPEGSAGQARVVNYRTSSVEIETDAPGQRFLVLLDVYYPGWKVFIDDAPAPICQANGVFRGVFVPGGRHTVTFRFEPKPFRLGIGLSAACAVLLAVMGLMGMRQRPAVPAPCAVPMAATPGTIQQQPVPRRAEDPARPANGEAG